MSVTERYNYFMSILMFQCINNPVLHTCKPLNSCFIFVKNDHNYPTRHSANQLPRPRREDKAMRALFSIKRELDSVTHNNIPLNIYIKLFNYRVLPILLYSSECWGAYLHKSISKCGLTDAVLDADAGVG